MSFLTDEQSAAGSRPGERYTFVTPTATYRYTSGPIALVSGLDTWTPQEGLKRSTVAGSSANDPPEMVIELPYDCPLVQAEAYSIPSYTIEMLLERDQPTGSTQLWRGQVTAFQTEGRTVKLRVPSAMDDALASTIPGVSFQFLCNHQLYDAMCGVNANDPAFKATTTLTAFNLQRTYTVASVAGKPDGWYTGGMLRRVADGEPRLIVEHVGATLKLIAPFRSWSAGQSVTLNAGCDHSMFQCGPKFGNAPNYGGFMGIPNLNPLNSLKGLL